MVQVNVKIDDKLKQDLPLKLRSRTELDEANYEADHHIYHGSYGSFEEYKKAMRK